MENKIVLVTGMSGAGKSSAMNALEDLGYYCMDNFPKELLLKVKPDMIMISDWNLMQMKI